MRTVYFHCSKCQSDFKLQTPNEYKEKEREVCLECVPEMMEEKPKANSNEQVA